MPRIARILTPLVAIVGVLLGIAVAAPASASELPPHRWETPRTVCVHSTMGPGWTSPRAAANRINDDIWYWNIVFRPSTSSCDSYDQVIQILRVNDASKGRAWTNKTTVWKQVDGETVGMINTATVYINTNSKFSRTWEQNVRTIVHELMHGMSTPRGSEWTGGHTSRCDSVLSGNHSCAMSHSGLTAYDKRWVRDLYGSWVPTFSL